MMVMMSILIISFCIVLLPAQSWANISPVLCPLQWTAAQIGRWTTWSTECCRVSRCGWNALCSMGTSGPIIARLRVWASVSCGIAALAWATATLRSPFHSMAHVWARRRTPFGSGLRTFRTLDFIPVSYGRWKHRYCLDASYIIRKQLK